MAGLMIVCLLLLLIIFVLSTKIIFMRKSINEISEDFSEKLKSDTNTLLTISSRDKAVRQFADNINEQLQELQKQRYRFVQGDIELKNAVTNISHDLRTPLTAISGYLELLDKEEKSDTIERYIKVIENRIQDLIQLSEELFRYSVITSAEQENDAETVVVNEVLEESILGFYAALQERGITPDISITETKVIRRMNRASLSRIFSNLISNSLKYSIGDLSIELTDDGEILFTNTSPDLTEVQMERLFDRFYTVETARKSTGLGLSITRILTEQMNGTVSAWYRDHRLSISVKFPDTLNS